MHCKPYCWIKYNKIKNEGSIELQSNQRFPIPLACVPHDALLSKLTEASIYEIFSDYLNKLLDGYCLEKFTRFDASYNILHSILLWTSLKHIVWPTEGLLWDLPMLQFQLCWWPFPLIFFLLSRVFFNTFWEIKER